MIHAYIANASLCNIPFLFLCFLCHPYIFTIFVENFYCSLIREYGSTLYVGMVLVVSFSPYIGIGAKFRIRLKIAETGLCRVKYRTAML